MIDCISAVSGFSALTAFCRSEIVTAGCGAETKSCAEAIEGRTAVPRAIATTVL